MSLNEDYNDFTSEPKKIDINKIPIKKLLRWNAEVRREIVRKIGIERTNRPFVGESGD